MPRHTDTYNAPFVNLWLSSGVRVYSASGRRLAVGGVKGGSVSGRDWSVSGERL